MACFVDKLSQSCLEYLFRIVPIGWKGSFLSLPPYLQLVHPLLQAVLGLGLLPHQDNVPRGIVDGDIGEMEASAHQLLQLIHTRRAQKHQGAGLGDVDHLTLQLHDLAEGG